MLQSTLHQIIFIDDIDKITKHKLNFIDSFCKSIKLNSGQTKLSIFLDKGESGCQKIDSCFAWASFKGRSQG